MKKKLKYKGDILFVEHHLAHAASSFLVSPFKEAAILTTDGVGEWTTTAYGYGKDKEIELQKEIKFPHSLGLLYSTITAYLGFSVNNSEYKVMGLAPYGNPNTYYDTFKELLTVLPDGSFKLNMKYFAHEYGTRMTNNKFHRLFGHPPRKPEDTLEQHHKDIAAALQKITEEIVLKVVAHAKELHPSDNLCLAGGVALNCVANGRILESGLFKNIYIQPAAGDAGGAIGAASYLYFAVLKNEKKQSVMQSVYLGPEFSDEEVKTFLERKENEFSEGLSYEHISDESLSKKVGTLLSEDNVIGWFQGRMEFGPRALGNRSILADARKNDNWQKVNLKIKYRESFRPFAPSVLEEKRDEYFDLKGTPSPHMLLVAQVQKDTVPAITHVDNSARIQSVSRTDNPRYYDLISSFYKLTRCPVIINTSFNVRSEPIVCDPKDAFYCFMNTEMDYLVLGNYLIGKEENPHLEKYVEKDKYLGSFELD